MARTYPPDVAVIDTDGILHARLTAGKKNANVEYGRTYRLPEGTFTNAVVTLEVPLSPNPFVVGENTVAVIVKQVNGSSSDLSFDLELQVTPAP